MRRSSAEVSLPGRHEHSAWQSRPVPNAMLALYRMPGLRCCFAECIAMCACRACMHTVSQPSADACLLVPIFADHVGGLHVAMRFEWCVQAFPSGHVGPPATAGKKRREGRDCETRGGGMGGAVPKRWRSVWCMLCAMHVSTGYAPGPRISVAFIARSSLAAITG